MIYALFGLVFGLFIPFLARRLGKILPATPAYAIYRILKPVKRTPYAKWKNNAVYVRLVKKFVMRSVGWSVICGALSLAAFVCFHGVNTPWLLFLIWTLLALYEIDERTLLLPDILTVPLLIGGFYYASSVVSGQAFHTVSPAEVSAMGAVLGYALPILASFFMVKKYPEAFGGGDIKLLAAVGAWIGFGAVPVLILVSCFIFALICLLRRQRAGAFGPSIVIATLGLVFFDNLYMIMP